MIFRRLTILTACCFCLTAEAQEAGLDAYISTGDNHWMSSSLPIDSPRSIDDTFEFLHKVAGVERVYWRGLEEATWIQTFDERPENCRYYTFWQWIRRLYRDVDPDALAAQAARKRGMQFWGVATMFDWGAPADTPTFGDYPNNGESRLRLQHPEWVPMDRHGFRGQGGPIEFAYPEARKALVGLHVNEMRRIGYDGIAFLTYLENYGLRFQDEFGFSPPVVEAFQKRVRQDLLRQPFTRIASREDWLRIRGDFITAFLRELKAALPESQNQIGVFIDPHDIRRPQPWNVPDLMRTAGAHHMDLETWVREGVVNLLPVWGYCAPQLQDAAVREAQWLVRDTKTAVEVVTSSPMQEKWARLRTEGVRTLTALGEDAHYASRGPVPEQTAEALTSGDLARTCKALAQIIEGKLAGASVATLAPLAKEGNIIQRRMALQALSLTKDAAALPVIEGALTDPENGIRCMAAQVLRTLNGPGSVTALLAAVEKFPTHPMRETAGTTLAAMKPFPRDALHAAIRESQSAEARIVALRALSPHATPADVPSFLEGLAKAERYPRFLAAAALGNVRNDEGAVKALLTNLTHHDAVIANRAAASLAEMARRNEPALKPHWEAATAKLAQRFSIYTSGYTGIDHDWGFRPVGNALLDFGAAGRAILEKAVANRTDLHHARVAFRVLYLPQKPNTFSEVTEAENDAAYQHLPPAPPPHTPTIIVVDPAGPTKTIAAAVKLARPGDTIKLTPGVYKESVVFHDRKGEYGKPITVDGQGATLDGSDDQNLTTWEDMGGGLFRKVKLTRMDDAVLGRWFMLFDGKVQRMGRCSKGPSLALKQPADLQFNEWTFVKAEDALYVKVRPGTRVAAPLRSNGVSISGTCRHLIIRNLTATHVYNDGYNIHGWCRDVLFENIKAIECGDDGISVHDDCQIEARGLLSQSNATGITDVGDSVSHYCDVTIRDCDGFDLFFIGPNVHSITNADVYSRAVRAVMVDGSRDNAALCRLRLENVKLLREGKPDEIRVTANSLLEMHNVEAVNLKLQSTGGSVSAHHCSFTGSPKQEIHLWPGSKWSGDHNVFDVSRIRFEDRWFYAKDAKAFSDLFKSDASSHWK